jgi:hypothetical protein
LPVILNQSLLTPVNLQPRRCGLLFDWITIHVER